MPSASGGAARGAGAPAGDREGAAEASTKAPPGERWFLSLLVVFSALALWQSYEISGFSSASGPGVFPMLASGTMLVASLTRLALRWGAGARAPGPLLALAWLFPARSALFAVLVVAFVAAIPRLGFMVAAGVFLFAALLLNWRQLRWPRRVMGSALITAVALAAIWLIFREAFQVVLPQGILWRETL